MEGRERSLLKEAELQEEARVIPGEAPAEERLGALPDPAGGFRFRVWAPRARKVTVVYLGPPERRFPLAREEKGYFVGQDPGARAGDAYWLSVDRRLLPDPASRSQPQGAWGPSALVDLSRWSERVATRVPIDLSRAVLYELHIGTFSPEGTFDGAGPRLEALARLGVTAVELLPIEEEQGDRGWGYGPIHQFAVRGAYGGPEGLLRFVAAAHAEGLGVLLDVVYNHWNVRAGFLERFGPYFHPRLSTPWGPTPRVTGPGSDEVRRYFFDNARMWLEEFGVDGFRLDAVHEIHDRSARRPFWSEFSEHCRSVAARWGGRPVLIGESDLNDVRILRPIAEGGWGLDAQWSDDFHHALHAALTGERAGYYADYGSLAALARAFERPFLFEGGFSRYRKRRHGAPVVGVGPEQFVVYDQNHDQIGNRGDGARLTTLLPDGLARVALGLTLFAPYVPMLFMGEEYGETRPFYFFTDLPRAFARRLAVRRFRDLRAHGFPDLPPDPSVPATMEQSRLNWAAAETPSGRASRAFVTELLRLRRELPALQPGGTVWARAGEEERQLVVRRDREGTAAALLANLGPLPRRVAPVDWPGEWRERLCSDDAGPPARAAAEPRLWSLGGGQTSLPVPPRSFVVLELAVLP